MEATQGNEQPLLRGAGTIHVGMERNESRCIEWQGVIRRYTNRQTFETFFLVLGMMTWHIDDFTFSPRVMDPMQ